ncbi:hypothetical protein [Salinarimonas rosea]|uniref:hypothetical protein n=1 Tax=Salinarimonas rosea TaxID=552063 RepID=UPI0004900979|nr:hypothetical protein [Salinarimonas rosea]
MNDALCVRFPLSLEQGPRSLAIDDGKFVHRFDDVPGGVFVRALLDCEIPRLPSDLVEHYADAKAQLTDFLSYCAAQGILTPEPGEYETISGAEFSEYLKQSFRALNDEMFSHELWQKLAAGKASATLVDGWLIETFFFIKGANARLPNAIANCTHHGIRNTLLHHYLEEWDHYGFFKESLELRGLDFDRIEARGPLPATKAVMLMARKAGRENSLGYLACSGLLESTGSDSSKAREFYGAIAAHYDARGTGFVAPMLEHIDLDEEFEHGDLMAEALGTIERLSRREADEVVNTLREFKETLVQWFDEIVEYYGRDVDVYGAPVSTTFSRGVFK